MLLLVFLLAIEASVVWVVVATVIAELTYILVTVFWSRILVPELKLDPHVFNWKTAAELTSFGIWTTIGRLGNIMYSNAATIVLNKMGSALDVANYHLGATLFRQMQGTLSHTFTHNSVRNGPSGVTGAGGAVEIVFLPIVREFSDR